MSDFPCIFLCGRSHSYIFKKMSKILTMKFIYAFESFLLSRLGYSGAIPVDDIIGLSVGLLIFFLCIRPLVLGMLR